MLKLCLLLVLFIAIAGAQSGTIPGAFVPGGFRPGGFGPGPVVIGGPGSRIFGPNGFTGAAPGTVSPDIPKVIRIINVDGNDVQIVNRTVCPDTVCFDRFFLIDYTKSPPAVRGDIIRTGPFDFTFQVYGTNYYIIQLARGLPDNVGFDNDTVLECMTYSNTIGGSNVFGVTLLFTGIRAFFPFDQYSMFDFCGVRYEGLDFHRGSSRAHNCYVGIVTRPTTPDFTYKTYIIPRDRPPHIADGELFTGVVVWY